MTCSLSISVQCWTWLWSICRASPRCQWETSLQTSSTRSVTWSCSSSAGTTASSSLWLLPTWTWPAQTLSSCPKMWTLRVKHNLWSSVFRDTESPLRAPLRGLTCTSQFFNYPTPSIRQYIAVYLVGSSMPTLDSWLRHLANPLRCILL